MTSASAASSRGRASGPAHRRAAPRGGQADRGRAARLEGADERVEAASRGHGDGERGVVAARPCRRGRPRRGRCGPSGGRVHLQRAVASPREVARERPHALPGHGELGAFEGRGEPRARPGCRSRPHARTPGRARAWRSPRARPARPRRRRERSLPRRRSRRRWRCRGTRPGPRPPCAAPVVTSVTDPRSAAVTCEILEGARRRTVPTGFGSARSPRGALRRPCERGARR